MELSFRPVTEDDVSLLHRWLNEPGILRWWEGDDVSWEAVARDYSPTTPGVEHWIGQLDGRDIGWIQVWAVADEPEETAPWLALGAHRSGAGIDYLIGEPDDRGQGLGSAMIRAFVDEIVFARHPEWTQAGAAPAAANRRSWRALERAGFRYLGEVPDKEGPGRLMVLDRVDT